MELRSSGSVLREMIVLDGADVLDVGSGDGSLVRYMTKHGARVTGLECGPAQLEKAHSFDREGEETYVEGVGQDMPFDNASFDAVVFNFSLHHIPEDSMLPALKEAARVAKPGATIYINEPIAEGSGFEVHQPIDDETEVRDKALSAIKAAKEVGLRQERELTFLTQYHYTDFEEMKDEMIRIDPTRKAHFESIEDDLRAGFERLGVREEKGMRFDQPVRVNILRKE